MTFKKCIRVFRICWKLHRDRKGIMIRSIRDYGLYSAHCGSNFIASLPAVSASLRFVLLFCLAQYSAEATKLSPTYHCFANLSMAQFRISFRLFNLARLESALKFRNTLKCIRMIETILCACVWLVKMFLMSLLFFDQQMRGSMKTSLCKNLLVLTSSSQIATSQLVSYFKLKSPPQP